MPIQTPARLLANIALPLLIALYPLAIYLGLTHGQQALLPWLMLSIAGIHALRAIMGKPSAWLWVLICLLLVAWSWMQQNTIGLKFYPVFINASMLLLFAWSVFSPPSAIERLARLKEPNLPASAIAYTRKVTLVWCLFFLLNGAIAAATVFASDAVWALYNGLIAYGLMALLFSVEWLVRRRVRSA